MESVPAEIIYQILLNLSSAGEYSSIIMVGMVCEVLQFYVESWRRELIYGLRAVAWRCTRHGGRVVFNEALVKYYGCDPSIIGNMEINNIPTIRNNLAYSAEIATEKFLSLSILIRNLLELDLGVFGHTVGDYNAELNYLCIVMARFMEHILEYKIDEHHYAHSINNVSVPLDHARSEYVLFFQIFNRLNTLICHVCKLINTEL